MSKRIINCLFISIVALVLLTCCAGKKAGNNNMDTDITSTSTDAGAKDANGFTEISVKDFCQEYNIMDFHEDCGALAVDNGNERNAMLISWCGIGYMWDNPTFTSYIFKDRYTQHILDTAEYYSISIFHNDDYDKSLVYLGTASGRNEDKFEGCGLREMEVDGVPCFADADYIIICKKAAYVDFDRNTMEDFVSYNSYYDDNGGVHRIFEGQIEKILKKN